MSSRRAPTLPPLDLPGELRIPSLGTLHEGPPRANWEVPLYNEPRRDPTPPRAADNGEHGTADQPDGLVGMIMELLGYAGPNAKARRDLLSFIFYLVFGFAQVRLYVFHDLCDDGSNALAVCDHCNLASLFG